MCGLGELGRRFKSGRIGKGKTAVCVCSHKSTWRTVLSGVISGSAHDRLILYHNVRLLTHACKLKSHHFFL